MSALEELAVAEMAAEQGASRCTDVANAHRLVEHFGDRMLYVEGIGWHTWGPPWRSDPLGARQIAHELGRIVADEAEAMAAWVAKAPSVKEMEHREAVHKARRQWAKSSESSPRITAALQEAEALLRCKADDMDADVMLLGVRNGVLELGSGQFRDYRQADRITKTCGVDYSPAAGCDQWLSFVDTIMGGDAELLEFMHSLAGYLLTGQRGEHVLPIFYGSGANGKSTLVGALQHVLGDYAGTAPPGLLIQRNGNEHPTGLASLHGRRLVVSSETGEGGRLNEEQVKSLTGGDRIAARRMRQDFYEFDPTHQLVLLTNHKPMVGGTDDGIWRRLRLVPFSITVPPEQRDARLPDKLRAEGSGILNWCMHGLQKYRAHGLPMSEAIRDATAEYRGDSDQVGGFLDECTAPGPGRVASGELYRSYVAWCDGSGERAMAQRQFGVRLAERGMRAMKGTAGARYWQGLRIVDAAAEYRRARGE
jgi:putative DNA primase/helicase